MAEVPIKKLGERNRSQLTCEPADDTAWFHSALEYVRKQTVILQSKTPSLKSDLFGRSREVGHHRFYEAEMNKGHRIGQR